MSYLQELHAAHLERKRRLSPPPKPQAAQPTPEPEPESPPPPPPPEPELELPPRLRRLRLRFDERTNREKMMQIVAAAAAVYGCSVAEVLGPSRKSQYCTPRHVAMYLTKRLTIWSTMRISTRFGGRDHTTVIHAIKKINQRIDFYQPYIDQILQRIPGWGE